MMDYETPDPAAQDALDRASPIEGARRRRLPLVLMLTLAAALTGAVTSSAFSHWTDHGSGFWRHHGFGRPMDPASVEERADRAVRHFAVEIDATAEQQDRLRAIVRAAVGDLLPMRERARDLRQNARALLTQANVDRTALERLRADQVAAFDTASRRVTQALADAAEVLTPEQRRKVDDLAPRFWRRWDLR